ncbi:MAG: hypothetical protein GX581_01270 [Syntrophomonadaceae bacterium]|nr:hypothetical protein [Syntrophomonadaceae bacterium]
MAKKIKINEYGQSHGDTFDSYLCAIRDDLPQNIKKYFYRIKSNGNVALHPADEKEYTASPQKILEYLYECLLWYFKKFERITIGKAKFVIPYHEMSGEMELQSIKDESEARLKQARIELEYKERLIEQKEREKIEVGKKVEEKDREIEQLKLEKTKAEKINEAKESRILSISQQLQEVKNESNKIVDAEERKRYQKLIRDYEENLREFKNENTQLKRMLDNVSSFDTYEDGNKILEINIREELLSDDLNEIDINLEKTSREIKRLKDLFNESFNIADCKYPLFYRSLNVLAGDQLRRSYVILEKINTGTILLNTVKNKISRSDLDELQAYIENEAKKLAVRSDQEIRLKLYYKLLEICDINSGCIANEREFKANCDKIVELSYDYLAGNKEFDRSPDKLEAINKYYIKKVINDFDERYNATDNANQTRLIDEIYNNFETLPEDEKKELYDKLGIKGTSEDAVKNSMKAIGPSVLLTALVSVGGFASYTTLSSIIFAVSQLLGVTFSFGVYTGAASFLSFLTGPFMILLLLGSGYFMFRQGRKQKEELVPLVVMQICISETSLNITDDYRSNYANMVSLWEGKKQVFESKKILEGQISNQLTMLMNNAGLLEDKISTGNNDLKILNQQFDSEQKQFFQYILLPTDKKRILNSYQNYQAQVDSLRVIQQNYGSGTGIKKYFSMAKDKIQEIPLTKKIAELENTLVLEAMNNSTFNSETIVLRNLQTSISEKKNIVSDLSRALKAENNMIEHEKKRLKSIKGELKIIQSEYLDIAR